MISKTIPLVTGQIVCETTYPELGLKYYGVKYYNLTLKCFDIVFIEEKQLHKIQSMETNQSCNHINSNNISYSPFID